GVYSVQAVQLSARTRALIRGIHVVHDTTVPADTLRKPGEIKVAIPANIDAVNGYLYVPGTTIDTFLNGNNGYVTLDSVPAGVDLPVCYAIRNNPALPQLVRGSVLVAPGGSFTISYWGWQSSKKLFLNTTASGANVAGTVTDFPVLVRLNAGNFDFRRATGNGADIRFTKSDGSPVPYEIEQWDSANAQAAIWVKVDTVYGNDNTHYLTIYWGAGAGAATSSLSNGAAVFDTTGGFVGVWHLNTLSDATLNGNTLTNNNSAHITSALIGGAQSFNGSAYLSAPDKTALNPTASITVSEWVNLTNDSLDQKIVGKSLHKGGYILGVGRDSAGNKTLYPEIRDSVDTLVSFWSGAFSKNTWTHLAFSYATGGAMNGYINGLPVNSIPASSLPTGVEAGDLVIGAAPFGPSTFSAIGQIDEVRVENKARSADWIKLCAMNQKADDVLVIIK
ncbi:MAG: DUF2341 domain-containing protein, partial [Chitinivibrionales bacterium]|nr:DUF2341 domain-containing protein [Chitinivibrionales bacterium]